MKTPVEIAEEAFTDAQIYSGYNDEARRRERDRMRAINTRYMEITIAALESAGFVIVDPERVTDEMIGAANSVKFSPQPPVKITPLEIADALRAAPKWTKGNEG